MDTPAGGRETVVSYLLLLQLPLICPLSSNLSSLFFPSCPMHAGTASPNKCLRYLTVTGSAAQTQGGVSLVFPLLNWELIRTKDMLLCYPSFHAFPISVVSLFFFFFWFVHLTWKQLYLPGALANEACKPKESKASCSEGT